MNIGEMKSAKGAEFIRSLGQRPRDSHNIKLRALKALFHGLVESRLQRLCLCESKSWGDAPGLDDGAPLALYL
jgi:hypothetical protein